MPDCEAFTLAAESLGVAASAVATAESWRLIVSPVCSPQAPIVSATHSSGTEPRHAPGALRPDIFQRPSTI
jgi:hypothetical protein